jgi:hypothetical protein
MFSQVPQTTAILENPFHFRIILKVFLASLGVSKFRIFSIIIFFSCVGQEQDREYDHTSYSARSHLDPHKRGRERHPASVVQMCTALRCANVHSSLLCKS